MSHRAIPSSARRVLRPTGQEPSSLHRPFAVSPTRRLASSAPLTISKKNRMNPEGMATPRLIHVVNLWSLRDYPSAARPWSLEEQLDAVKAAGFDGFTTQLGPQHAKEAEKRDLLVVGYFASSEETQFGDLLTSQKDAGAHHINVHLSDHDTLPDDALDLPLSCMHQPHTTRDIALTLSGSTT